MRYLTFVTLIITILIAGCQTGNATNKNVYSQIAGTWKAESMPWQVTISEDGNVTSAIHPMGEAEIKPNEITTIDMKDGNISSYTGGDFSLAYDIKKSEMEVILEVQNLHIKYLHNEIIGNTKTIIYGPIYVDKGIWDAELIYIFDFGSRFPQAEEDILPLPMRFIKTNNQSN